MASPGLPSRGNNRNGGSIPGGGGSSFIRASASRVTPSTSSYLSGDDDDDDAQTLPREPMRRMNWTPPGDTSSSENRGENRTRTPAPLDEWDYAERGPLARLKTRQLTEVAREKAGMGVYGKGLSHVPRSAYAISHTRPAKGLLRPEGTVSNPSYYGVQYTLLNPSYQSRIYPSRLTDTLFFTISGRRGARGVRGRHAWSSKETHERP
jgi:hypothetical protein